MKKKYLLLLLLFIPLIKVNALFCEYDELAKVQKEASNVGIISEYVEKDASVTFTITIYNLRPGQYIINKFNKKKYEYGYDSKNPSEIVFNNVTKEGMYSFDVYSTKNECNEDPLATLYAELPAYNKYYLDEVCVGAESYNLCQRWYSTNLSYDEFKKNVLAYKNIKPDDNEENKPTGKGIIDYIIEFYLDYYMYIFGGIILILIGPIIYIYRTKYKVGF